MSLTEKTGVEYAGTKDEYSYSTFSNETSGMSGLYVTNGEGAGSINFYTRDDYSGSIQDFQKVLREILEWTEKQTAKGSQ